MQSFILWVSYDSFSREKSWNFQEISKNLRFNQFNKNFTTYKIYKFQNLRKYKILQKLFKKQFNFCK